MARVPYVTDEDLPPEYRDLIVSSLQGRRLHVYQSIGNNPEVLAGLRGFFASLWTDTGLDERGRELVILAVSREAEFDYEWHQHVRIARGVGVTDEEILAISEGRLETFDTDDRELIEYAIAVVREEVDDALHDRLAERHGNDTIVGIAALAGAYAMLGQVLAAFDVELEEPFVGWTLSGD
ncbi:carboxymuconolactone decarboxylase family protein [Natronorarus salvus]|uniref:carboxymuconolactone decarboxylase family protein n=1 Tax=Natronorarus salvus TaxID=3117733 RepID=UPI002F261190